MFLRKKSKITSRKIIASQDLSKRLASRILREATWLILLFIGLYITLALVSYSSIDPSWMHSTVPQNGLKNLGGLLGAHFSGFALSAFGISSWWLVFLSIYSISLIYPRIENEKYETKHRLIVHYAGFILLLFSSATFEAGYIVDLTSISLPSGQGGMVGNLVNEMIVAF